MDPFVKLLLLLCVCGEGKGEAKPVKTEFPGKLDVSGFMLVVG